MAKYIFLTGIAKWAKVHKPDQKYNFYGLDLYLDKDSMKAFKESGLSLEIREGDDGSYIRPRRDPEKLFEGMSEKPKVLIRDGSDEDGKPVYVPFADNIGNGSFVTCKIEVFETKRGMGHRLEAVAVENLVAYDGGDNDDLPF